MKNLALSDSRGHDLQKEITVKVTHETTQQVRRQNKSAWCAKKRLKEKIKNMCAACSFLWNPCSTVLCPNGALLFYSPTLWCPFSVPPCMNYSLPKPLLDLFPSQKEPMYCLLMGQPFSWVACIMYRRCLRCINSAPIWLICPGIFVYAWPPSNSLLPNFSTGGAPVGAKQAHLTRTRAGRTCWRTSQWRHSLPRSHLSWVSVATGEHQVASLSLKPLQLCCSTAADHWLLSNHALPFKYWRRELY